MSSDTVTIRFYTADLFQRDGNQDGDILENCGIVPEYLSHDALWDVWDCFVVPQIKEDVKPFKMGYTAHNPVRCNIVDGKGVDYTYNANGIVLTPEFVDVSIDEIKKLLCLED